MAKLSAHGAELARRETTTGRIALMADGNILRNQGNGWKLWKRVKPGVDVEAYADKFRAFTAAMPGAVVRYIQALENAVDLKHRATLHTLITLMPGDPDGVWSEFELCGYQPSLGDVLGACDAYAVAQLAIQSEKEVVAG